MVIVFDKRVRYVKG